MNKISDRLKAQNVMIENAILTILGNHRINMQAAFLSMNDLHTQLQQKLNFEITILELETILAKLVNENRIAKRNFVDNDDANSRFYNITNS